jgi:hypothetical protein
VRSLQQTKRVMRTKIRASIIFHKSFAERAKSAMEATVLKVFHRGRKMHNKQT